MTKTATHDFDMVIHGGGLIGATAALLLSKKGWQVALVESLPPKQDLTIADSNDWDSRIFAINPTNQAFLRQWNIWPDSRTNPVQAMDIVGDTGGHVAFLAKDTAIDALAWIVEGRSLASALYARLAKEKVTLFTHRFATTLTTDEEHAHLQLNDGQWLHCRLLIGADGGHSWVREHSHIPYRVHHYQQSAVVANFACEQPHHHIARQWFLGNGILAWLPLPGNRISMVWSHASPELLLGLDEKTLADYVAQAGRMTLGKLTTITPARAFPLYMTSPQSITANRTLLMGDAAHLIHPLAGQGVNLGFSDVKAFVNQLTSGVDPGDATELRRFEKHRLLPVKTMQHTCNLLFRLFHAPYIPGLPWLRNAALSSVNRSTPLRRQLIRLATGF